MDKYIHNEQNGLWYELQGDYYLPCLKLPGNLRYTLVSGDNGIADTSKATTKRCIPLCLPAAS